MTTILGYDTPDGMPAATTLDLYSRIAELVRLAENTIQILAVRMFGNGPDAGLEIDLSNGQMLECERFKDIWGAANLARWITQSVGINAGAIKKPDADEANALLRRVAVQIAAWTRADLGRDQGLSFLAAAPIATFRMHDQADRWAAFAKVNRLDPAQRIEDRFEGSRAPDPATIAASSLVLLDALTGWRFVPMPHFYSFVRALGYGSEVIKNMGLAGWTKSGKRGDVKATSPSTSATIRLRLWRIPPGWEETGDDEQAP